MAGATTIINNGRTGTTNYITPATTINDLPDVILSIIFSSIFDTRSRNAASLVSRRWNDYERATRTHLKLRGNVRDLDLLPNCFRSVTHLDLSFLSPWGHCLLSLSHNSSSAVDADPLAHWLSIAFPSVTSLTLYARSSASIALLSLHFPCLTEIKLVRWHQRPQVPYGADFFTLFQNSKVLESIDLSCFYCWTEDLPPALNAHPAVGSRLSRLDLFNFSLADGFKSHEVMAITKACPNLKELLIACTFDRTYMGFVGDEALLAITSNCRKLRLLHLADISSTSTTQGWGDVAANGGFASEEAGFSISDLKVFFSGLELIEDLALDVCKNVRDTGNALEKLASSCPNLKSLKLGCFHGLCMTIESQLDGIALCQGLESLSIKNSADLSDSGLIAIGRGCSRLAKFEIHGCKRITMRGLRTMVCLLRKTLVEVGISCCTNLDAAASIQAIEPIHDRIKRLHIDCIWNGVVDTGGITTAQCFDLNEIGEGNDDDGDVYNMEKSRTKRCKLSSDMEFGDISMSNGNGMGYWNRSWDQLRFLSLWIGVGELLTPMSTLGLEDCPNLAEISIKVEGDCRERPKPPRTAFGLSSLCLYPMFTKLKLDCGDVTGYALTAPSGYMDLSLWERFYLNEVQTLTLNEFDYWPPQDREVNQRSLSLPAAGLLAQCDTLRKLFIHGTAHEHFMNFLLRIPNLRDVQLREDYYPAPENDMSTEMRVDSCWRFEDALNRRAIPD